MKRRAYSAGAVKVSFWFIEFRKTVQLLADGYSWEEIRQMSEQNNIFNASTPMRAKQIYSSVSARIKALDDSVISVFLNSDITMQKILVLTAILAYDTLFFDFVYEVLREKMIIGDNEYTNRDWRVFCAEKQRQDKRASTWTEQTLIRLGRAYKTMLYEAGIISSGKDIRHIYRTILDPSVEQWMMLHGLKPVVKALTGVK